MTVQVAQWGLIIRQALPSPLPASSPSTRGTTLLALPPAGPMQRAGRSRRSRVPAVSPSQASRAVAGAGAPLSPGRCSASPSPSRQRRAPFQPRPTTASAALRALLGPTALILPPRLSPPSTTPTPACRRPLRTLLLLRLLPPRTLRLPVSITAAAAEARLAAAAAAVATRRPLREPCCGPSEPSWPTCGARSSSSACSAMHRLQATLVP